jgi:hypothetical protein
LRSQRVPSERSMVAAAVRVAAGPQHVRVARGSWLLTDTLCSCLQQDCPLPGLHPMEPGWHDEATNDPREVWRLWRDMPYAGLVVLTGDRFDVLDVPAQLGARIAEYARKDRRSLGPIAAGPDRWSLFVAAAGPPERVASAPPANWRRLGVLRRGAASYVVWPPSGRGSSAAVRWLRPPRDCRWIDALPPAVDLLAPLAARLPRSFDIGFDLGTAAASREKRLVGARATA